MTDKVGTVLGMGIYYDRYHDRLYLYGSEHI
jgi:hypothetical protein